MSNERHDLFEILRVHGGAPEHMPGFEARLTSDLYEADLDMGRVPKARGWIRRRTTPGGRRLHLAWAGVVTLVLASLIVLAGLPAGERVADRLFGGTTGQRPVFPGPEPAKAQTVAEVARITREALRAARTITGDYGRWIGKPGSKPRFEYAIHVVLAADGSRWVTADHQAACWELTYDADTGLKRVWFGEFSPRPRVRIFSEEYAHVPPGEPDGGDSRAVFAHPTPGGMGWELFGVVARIALANPDGEAKTGRFDGRPVWIVSCPVMPREPSGPSGQASLAEGGSASKEDELSVSVDQETGLPVRVQAWVDGKLRAEGRLVNLTVDETVPADTFTLGSPVKAAVGTTENGQLELRVDLGTKTTRMLLPYDKATVSADEVRLSVARVPRVSKDLGFRPTSMNQVGSATGRVTLVPARIPAGFALQSVAVKRRQQAAGPPADSAAAARAGTGVVMLHYRAAMQEITVTTRRLDPTVSKASAVRIDPFIGDKWPGWIDSRTPVKVTDGAFAGARGAVVIAPLTIPHLWAVKDGVLLTVAGDCSAEELLAIAESMEPWTAGAEAPLPAIDLSGKP